MGFPDLQVAVPGYRIDSHLQIAFPVLLGIFVFASFIKSPGGILMKRVFLLALCLVLASGPLSFSKTTTFKSEEELRKKETELKQKGLETQVLDVRKYGYSLEDVRKPGRDICCQVTGNKHLVGCWLWWCLCVVGGCQGEDRPTPEKTN